ncbi:MAG: dihydrodipicolinate synthase family protein [Gemmatimonadetes bacterium]|nr:dihydrodipicolinate synthase family protein [Gemmatimonadota bacterium]
MNLRAHLLEGQVIPAHPLALTPRRTLDERRQVALTRYYVDAGAGGVAVGVHTTQFQLRDHGMLRPVLQLARDTVRAWQGTRPVALIAGAIGDTRQAVDEAEAARLLGYDAVLLGLGAMRDAPIASLIAHCRRVAEILPLIGFYLQPAVGGRVLDFRFWRELAEIPNLVAIKIAPFNRYQTLDVVRAITEAGRDDVALYTGNDDNIVVDLLTPFAFDVGGRRVERRIVGGLLGQWAVWTRTAVELLQSVRAVDAGAPLDRAWLTQAAALTDANGVVFDAANAFRGCIPGIHEVLRRQGLLQGTWCLDTGELLSPGQERELDRVARAYPELTDDAFVAEHRDRWLA